MSARHRFSVGIDINTSRCRTCGVYRQRHQKRTTRAMKRGDDYSLIMRYAPSDQPDAWRTEPIPCRAKTEETTTMSDDQNTLPGMPYTAADEYMRLLEWGEAAQGHMHPRAWWDAQRAQAETVPPAIMVESNERLATSFARMRGEPVDVMRESMKRERPPMEYTPERPVTIDMNTLEQLADDFKEWARERGSTMKITPHGDRETRLFEAGVAKAFSDAAVMLRGAFGKGFLR